MNRKQAFSAILFISIFVVLLCSVTYMIRTNGHIKEIFVGFYAEPEDTIDVIMIGSSPVYPYYSAPQIWGEYGITCYPLSSNVQRPKAAIYLVKEALKTQKPELFVFELRQFIASDEAMTENMAYTRGVTDNLKYSWNRIQMINALVSDSSERYTYYFDIFKYHSNWKTIILPDQYSSFCYERLHPLKGFWLSDKVVPGETENVSAVTETEPIPAEEEETLYQLLDYLKSHDLEALFIVSPKTMSEEEQKKFNYMKDIIETYDYNYLNMNDYCEEMKLDFSSDFYDGGGHTNAAGAEKCTDFLGQYISRNYEITDKRGDSSYQTWDVAYEYWKQCQKDALQIIHEKVASGKYDEMGDAE